MKYKYNHIITIVDAISIIALISFLVWFFHKEPPKYEIIIKDYYDIDAPPRGGWNKEQKLDPNWKSSITPND